MHRVLFEIRHFARYDSTTGSECRIIAVLAAGTVCPTWLVNGNRLVRGDFRVARAAAQAICWRPFPGAASKPKIPAYDMPRRHILLAVEFRELCMPFLPIVSQPFAENSYVVWLDGRQDCLIVDPGLEPEKILAAIDEQQLAPAAILITHGHSDHIAGNGAMKERWPDCPLVIGINEADKLIDPRRNLSAQFGFNLVSPPADVLVRDGEVYSAAGFDWEVREIPGHSSGHVVFVARQLSPIVVIGGDVLFAGSVGRTDFPDGSFEQLAAGIHEKLFTLADDTIVLPGHGEPTTIGQERKFNPYVGATAMR